MKGSDPGGLGRLKVSGAGLAASELALAPTSQTAQGADELFPL